MKRKVVIFLSLILCFGLLCVSSSAAWQVADAKPLYDYLFDVDEIGDDRERLTFIVDDPPTWSIDYNEEGIIWTKAEYIDIPFDMDADEHILAGYAYPFNTELVSIEDLVEGANITISSSITYNLYEYEQLYGHGYAFLKIRVLNSSGATIANYTGARTSWQLSGVDALIQQVDVACSFTVPAGAVCLLPEVTFNFEFEDADWYSTAPFMRLLQEPVYFYMERDAVKEESELMEEINAFVEAEAERQADSIGDLNDVINGAADSRPVADAIVTDPSGLVDSMAMASLSSTFGSFYALSPVAGFLAVLGVLIPVSYILFGKK